MEVTVNLFENAEDDGTGPRAAVAERDEPAAGRVKALAEAVIHFDRKGIVATKGAFHLCPGTGSDAIFF